MRRLPLLLQHAFAVLIMAALPVVAYWSLITPFRPARASTVAGDFTEVHFPMHYFVVQSWQHRRLPLWAPGVNGGQPAFADMQFDAFYPPTVLIGLLLGPHGTFTPAMLLRDEAAHILFGEVGMYLLALRLLGYRRQSHIGSPFPRNEHDAKGAAAPAALAGAIVFGFSGYLTTYPLQDTDILQVSIWLPWAILALDVAIVRRSFALALIAGLPVGMAVLAGHPQALLYIVCAHALYTASMALFVHGTAGARLATLTRGLMAIGGGLSLGAIQLLPTLQLAPLTVRGSESYAFLSGGFAPHELLGAVLPSGFGGAAPAYLGVAALALALIGALRGAGGMRVYALTLGAIALLLSLGNHTPVYRLAYRAVPGFAEVRDQERAFYLVTFAVALLAARGVQRLVVLRPKAGRGRSRLPPLFGVLLVAAVAFSLAFSARPRGDGAGPVSATVQPDVLGLDHALLLLVAIGLAVTLAIARPGLRSVAGWLCAALCAVDLLSAHPGYGVQRDGGNPYPAWGIIRTMQSNHGGPFRVSSEGLLPADGNESLIYGLEDVVGSTPLELSNFAALNQAEQQHAIDEIHRFQLLAVRYVVTRRVFAADAPLISLGSQGNAHLYRLSPGLATPRAWLVHQAVAPSAQALWATIGRSDLKSIAVLAAAPPFALGSPGDDQLELTSYQPTALAWTVDAATPALLVVSEINYPGWQATIDGKRAAVLPADGAIDAIPMPAGAHRVTLEFAPPILRLGASITLATLALEAMILAGIAWAARRNIATNWFVEEHRSTSPGD